MLRNKQIIFMLGLGLMLTGCSTESSDDTGNGELYLDALTETNEDSSAVTGETTMVQRRDITLEYTFSAERVYPFSKIISYENEYASGFTFGECLVSEEEYVVEGQEIVLLHQYIDEIDAEEVRVTYERESASFTDSCEDYEEQLATLTEGSLEYVQLNHEYESYKADQEELLAEMEEKLAAYDEIRENPDVYLTAPFDGYVSYVVNRYEGEAVTGGETMVVLEDVSVWYYTLTDTGVSIPAGREVILYDDTWDEGVLQINGTVACADMALENDYKKGYAIAMANSITVGDTDVTDTFDPTELPASLSVQMNQLELNNVLTVPAGYLYTSGERYYVYLLKDGKQVKTYVICLNDSINGYAWIISGIEEGDTLVKAN